MSPKKPILTIIIVTWNTADITHKCIRTIMKYLSDLNPEIIVVDNGSTDNTQELLSKLPITYVRNPSNLGFSKANNIGFKQAKGEYVLFLNSDMELVDSSITLMLEHIKKDNKVGIIGPRFLNIDLTDQASVFPDQSVINAIKEFFFKQPAYSKYLPSSLLPSQVYSVSGGALLISSRLFQKVGGWNEKYYFYYEDLDLCRQVRRLGYKIIYFPECRVVHHHGASGKKIATDNNQWRRLIPSSILYHGFFKHYLINSIIWLSQKWQKLFRK